jgi:hypothetical protein
MLSSTYVPAEHRIRDTVHVPGHRVLTFAQALKYNAFPLADILLEFLAIGEEGMGCPVELEFSVNLHQGNSEPPDFAVLQLRPMTARAELETVTITDDEVEKAFCVSNHSLGNAVKTDIADVVFVKPDGFDPAKTVEIAREIGEMNGFLLKEDSKYLLVGPGRWGSADRWLGIPVTWPDISGVGAIAETTSPLIKAEPSQGSHFFHNITTMGINYINVSDKNGDFFNWDWLSAIEPQHASRHVAHVRLEKAMTIKVDGRKSQCVIYI